MEQRANQLGARSDICFIICFGNYIDKDKIQDKTEFLELRYVKQWRNISWETFKKLGKSSWRFFKYFLLVHFKEVIRYIYWDCLVTSVIQGLVFNLAVTKYFMHSRKWFKFNLNYNFVLIISLSKYFGKSVI